MGLIFKNGAERLQAICEAASYLYPTYQPCFDFYEDIIQRNVKGKIVLDGGCGAQSFLGKFKPQIKRLIGLDKDGASLMKNQTLDQKVVAYLEEMPLKDESVDMVVATFVLEHLTKPEEVLKEAHRVLKKGGHFIFMTPNIFNPIILVSKILPYSVHQSLRNRLLKKEEGTYQTFYRANTSSALKSLGEKAGFREIKIDRAGNPEYLAFAKPLVGLAVVTERVISFGVLKNFQMYLIGDFKK